MLFSHICSPQERYILYTTKEPSLLRSYLPCKGAGGSIIFLLNSVYCHFNNILHANMETYQGVKFKHQQIKPHFDFDDRLSELNQLAYLVFQLDRSLWESIVQVLLVIVYHNKIGNAPNS